jgi:hypothetical protein
MNVVDMTVQMNLAMSAEMNIENGQAAKATLLLRSCQLGILAAGILLIAIGCGLHAGWVRALVLLLATAAATGLFYENRRSHRGEGPIALALPVAGALSGIFALLTSA